MLVRRSARFMLEKIFDPAHSAFVWVFGQVLV
jgi:hypothetical protein